MKYEKFTVKSIQTTSSGRYAVYISERGFEVWTGDFRFKAGDVVEWWGYDGYCPSRIVVNGKETWNEADKIKYWQTKEQRDHEVIEQRLKAKGIHHPVYNPGT